MVCVTSRGGDYSQGPLASFDFVETYLRSIFGFVGLTNIKFFNVQPMDISGELRKTAFKAAIRDVRSWVANGAWDGSQTIPAQALPADVKPQVILENS